MLDQNTVVSTGKKEDAVGYGWATQNPDPATHDEAPTGSRTPRLMSGHRFELNISSVTHPFFRDTKMVIIL